MAQKVIKIRLEERGYYGGKWFDTSGVYVVPDTDRMRKAIQRDPEATIEDEFTGEYPDGVYRSITADSFTSSEATIGGSKFHVQPGRPAESSEDDIWIDPTQNTRSKMKVRKPRGWLDMSAPPEPKGPDGDWTLLVHDEFNGDSLNTDLWGVNGGETKNPLDDDADTDDSLVDVSDGTCTLQVTSNGTGATGAFQGPISTYPGDQDFHANVGFATGNDPGVFIETRARVAGPRNGLLPAFWLNGYGPGSWPPEIDIYELFQTSSPPDAGLTVHSSHWATTEMPGDYDAHIGVGYDHDHGSNTTDEMHVYGTAWFQDRVEFYIDGSHVATHDLLPMLRTMNNADRADMYLKFTTHVNRVGSADLQSEWTEESEIDYVRVWEYDGKAPSPPSAPTFTTIDNFDGGTLAGGWNDPNGAWTTTTNYSQSGSASVTNTATSAPLGWEGTPSFAPNGPGTRIEYDFAFSDATENRLNTRFGADTTTDGTSYRLDILDGDVYLFETQNWNAINHDTSFSITNPFEFHTARIEFTGNNVLYEIESPSGDLLSTTAKYDTLGFTGDIFTFNVETGTAYVDEVRVTTDP